MSAILAAVAGGAGLLALSYVGYVARAFFRYGREAGTGLRGDDLLDRFMPTYEVAEHHEVRVAAPADVTYEVAREMDLWRSRLARAIFRGRELLLRGKPGEDERPRALLAQCLSLGWVILAEVKEREIVVGALTRPWEANVRFRPLPPEEFAAFHEPGYAKIVWTLAVEPIGDAASLFRTDTRVVTTDPVSRARFRRYWAMVLPGIVLMRRVGLGLVKAEAERRARNAA